MASQTLKWRIDRVKTLLRKFAPSLEISDQMIQLMVHFSRNDVYKKYMPQREHLCRKTVAITDGDPLPADYVRYAENAVHTVATGPTAGAYPCEYIPIEKIPFVKGQPLFMAYPESPKISICDQKFLLFPAGITADVDIYYRPTDLWNSANSIPLTTTDNTPQEMEYAIVRGAFERSVAYSQSKEIAVQLMEKNKMESEEAALEFYQEAFGAVQNIQPIV